MREFITSLLVGMVITAFLIKDRLERAQCAGRGDGD